jgi:FAD:protein FMN transferase
MKSAVTPETMTIRCDRLAMATRFEMLLVGDDEEHLRAVGEAALDEVTRIDCLLSRHNPASEVSRVNLEAAWRPVRVDRELFAILMDCRSWFAKTQGYFDICATGAASSARYDRAVELDSEAQTVRFLGLSTRLDFGGYGKGYALDRAGRVLDEFGVAAALMHGGTSSVLARGRSDPGTVWRIGLRDPFGRTPGAEVEWIDLVDRGLSSSAAFGPGQETSDIVDPIHSLPLDEAAAITVVAPTALEAEVLSTALLAMGRTRAIPFLDMFHTFPNCQAAWVVEQGSRVDVVWSGRVGGR